LILLVIIKFMHAWDLRRLADGRTTEEEAQERTFAGEMDPSEKKVEEEERSSGHDDIRLVPFSR